MNANILGLGEWEDIFYNWNEGGYESEIGCRLSGMLTSMPIQFTL